MAKQIGNQELLETWASEGDVSEPFLSKKRQGWLFQEQPASSIANWLVNIQGQKLNHLLKNGVSEWSTNTDYTRGAIVKHANTAWRALRENTASEPAPGNLDWAEVSTLPILRAPDLISPVDGASGVTTTVALTASGYASVYSVDGRDYREFEVDVSGGDFSTPVRTNQVDADAWAVDPALDASAGYEWRCRDVSTRGDVSEWSVIEPFTTGANFVTTPSITAPADNAIDITETPTFESSAFAVTGTTDTHVASYWRVYQGTTLVWETGRTTSGLESATIPSGILVDGQTVYKVQVRHEGDTLGLSAWSTASTFTTLDTFTRVAQPSITSPLAAETDIPETPTFESSAFSVVNGSDTHAASRWEVYTPADALVWASGRDTINRTSITIPSGILSDGETTYKVRVQHEGQSLGVSEWGDTVSFVTQESFGFVFAGLFGQETKKIGSSGLTSDGDYTGHLGRVNDLAFGGGFLFTASLDRIRKINIETMSSVSIFTGFSSEIQSLTYGDDGFLYGLTFNEIKRIDPSDMTSAGGTNTINSDDEASIIYGDDDRIYRVGTSGGDSLLQKYDNTTDMNLVSSYSGDIGWDYPSVCYGTDGFVYVGTTNFLGSGVRIEKINPTTMTLSDTLSGIDPVVSLAFGNDGFLYAGTNGGVVKVNPSTMTVVSTFTSAGTGSVITFGADGFLYSGGTDNVVRKIDPADMTEAGLITLGSDVTALAFNISIPDLLGFTL